MDPLVREGGRSTAFCPVDAPNKKHLVSRVIDFF